MSRREKRLSRRQRFLAATATAVIEQFKQKAVQPLVTHAAADYETNEVQQPSEAEHGDVQRELTVVSLPLGLARLQVHTVPVAAA